MKKLIFALLFTFGTSLLIGQSNRYEKAMEKGVQALDTASSISSLQLSANHFARIAKAEPGLWLPHYYQAYSEMLMATKSIQLQDKKGCNNHIDAAQTALDLSKKSLGEYNAEILALQSFIYTGRIWEDPMTKGAEYTPVIMEALEKAIEKAPNNPRPHYLKGQMILYTPAFWGGGPENALPHLEKADELFKNYQLPSKIHPNWGKQETSELIVNVKERIENKNK